VRAAATPSTTAVRERRRVDVVRAMAAPDCGEEAPEHTCRTCWCSPLPEIYA
jgi:hypothetical protein